MDAPASLPSARPDRCLCGCGKKLEQPKAGVKYWYNDACRKRAARRRARAGGGYAVAAVRPPVDDGPLPGSGEETAQPTVRPGRVAPLPPADTETGRALRDLLLLEMMAAGASLPEMVAADGRLPGEVRDRVEELSAGGGTSAGAALLRRDPLDVVEGVLRRTLFTWNLLARVAGEAASDSARVSALRGMLDADARSVALLQSLGRLPKELGTLRHVVEVRSAAREMLEIVRAMEEGRASPADARKVLMRYAGGDVLEADPSGPPPASPGGEGAPPAQQQSAA